MPILETAPGRRFPIVSLVGGKWTTFRGFAEEAADLVLTCLDRKRRVSTQNLPNGGGRDFPRTPQARAQWIASVGARTGLSIGRLVALLSRYGTTAR